MRESREIENAMSRAETEAGKDAAPPMSDEQKRAFRTALGQFATGVTIVTTTDAETGAPVGITANSFASVSLDPALVLWSAARSSVRHGHFTQARAFAIHVLCHEQAQLARRFTRDGSDFTGIAHHPGVDNVPLIEGVLARFECLTEATHEGGDHTIIIGRVTGFTQATAEPLLFSAGRFGRFLAD